MGFTDTAGMTAMRFDVYGGQKTKHASIFRNTHMNKRSEILASADALINGDRQAEYGPPSENFERIAVGWAQVLGCEVSGAQVDLCITWLKIARAEQGSGLDSFIDGAGYMALAGELAENKQ